MAVFKSELDSIISQIRSGNTDPELIASALEALAKAGFTRDYDIMVIQFRGWDGTTPYYDILENTFGVLPTFSVINEEVTVRIGIPNQNNMNETNTRVYFENGNGAIEEPAAFYYYAIGLASNSIDITPIIYNFPESTDTQSYSFLGGYIYNTLVIKKLK